MFGLDPTVAPGVVFNDGTLASGASQFFSGAPSWLSAVGPLLNKGGAAGGNLTRSEGGAGSAGTQNGSGWNVNFGGGDISSSQGLGALARWLFLAAAGIAAYAAWKGR